MDILPQIKKLGWRLLLISSCLTLLGCGDAMVEAKDQEAKLHEEISTLASESSELQGKITTIEKAYPQLTAAKSLAAKELANTTNANDYLQRSIKIIQATVDASNQKVARYRAKYLPP